MVISRRVLLAVLLLAGACIDTGAEPVAVPLSLAGTDVSGPVMARDGVPVELERADLAFGPLTLCAGLQAGDLCGSALAEWTESAVIDTLDPSPREVGELTGISGSARSYMYDLGYVSALVSTEPLELEAAASLGGASLVLEGVATFDGRAIPFSLRSVYTQPPEVERGIPIVRSSGANGFALELDGATPPLTIRFDPARWLTTADFRTLVQDTECTRDGTVVCAGALERRCEPGAPVERDCAALGQVCAPNVGCVERVEVPAGSQIAGAVRDAILAGAAPAFE